MKIEGKEYRTIWFENNVVKIIDQTKPVGNIVISKKIANDCICLAVINQVDSTSELTVNEKSIELL